MVDGISGGGRGYKVEVKKFEEEAKEEACKATENEINIKFGDPTTTTCDSLNKIEEDFAEFAKNIFEKKQDETFMDKILSFFGNKAKSKSEEGGGYGQPSEKANNNIGQCEPNHDYANETPPTVKDANNSSSAGGGYGHASKTEEPPTHKDGGYGHPSKKDEPAIYQGGGYAKHSEDSNISKEPDKEELEFYLD